MGVILDFQPSFPQEQHLSELRTWNNFVEHLMLLYLVFLLHSFIHAL